MGESRDRSPGRGSPSAQETFSSEHVLFMADREGYEEDGYNGRV